jgi:hypothetical protein
MKKLAIATATAALALSFNASAKLDKEEREEYMLCQKVAWVAETYGITWFDSTSWEETLALYHSEMSELEIRKLDKKVDREIKKAKRTMDNVIDQLGDYIPEEHYPYVIYTGVMMDEKGQAGFYECQL